MFALQHIADLHWLAPRLALDGDVRHVSHVQVQCRGI